MVYRMNKIHSLDERRQIIIPGDYEETLRFSVDHWIQSAHKAIKEKGTFCVALSGESTPKKIFQALSSEKNRGRVEWSKVYLFWSDERAVPHDHPESNYHMAMVEGGMGELPIPVTHIFRMHGEEEP